MLILRQKTEHTLRWLAIRTAQQQRCYAKNYSSSDDEKESTNKKISHKSKPDAAAKAESGQESAAERLNRLLAHMTTDDSRQLKSSAQTLMARPGQTQKLRKEVSKQEVAAKDVVTAAKRVALLLGEHNQKQTESELLGKLMGHGAQELVAEGDQKSSSSPKETHEKELSISELIVGMKIDRSETKKDEPRSEFIRRTLLAKRPQHREPRKTDGGASRTERTAHKRQAVTYTGSVNISGGEGMGIFKHPEKLRDSPDMLATWSQLHEHELKLLVTHPPANYFEKIARWTEEGKVWRFPIDNEQDWSDEIDVDFSEHIFLDQHLESWCPTRGPIRHFMELVCVGLSKNPYITAAEKKDHIMWYRDYFDSKRELLQDVISDSNANLKQVES